MVLLERNPQACSASGLDRRMLQALDSTRRLALCMPGGVAVRVHMERPLFIGYLDVDLEGDYLWPNREPAHGARYGLPLLTGED
jgi:hypothetical protein